MNHSTQEQQLQGKSNLLYTVFLLKKTSFSLRIAEVPALLFFPMALTRWAVLTPMEHATGGSVIAAKMALKRGNKFFCLSFQHPFCLSCIEQRTGFAINLGGGFHHASSNRVRPFCT